MIKWIFIFLAMAPLGRVKAQAITVDSRHEKMPSGTGDGNADFTFPMVQSPGNPEVANRINTYLQISELGLIIGHQKKNIFENSSKNSADDYNFTVTHNAGNILSITTTESGCGCRCTSFSKYYLFDARNGSLVHTEDLFTPEGIKQIGKSLLAEWKIKIPRPANDKELFADEFKECLKNANQMEYLAFYVFYISDGKLKFQGGQCLDATESSQDQSGYFERTYDQCKSSMTAYGRSLFEGNATSPVLKPRLFDNVLQGTIDKYPVTLVLNQSDNYLGGSIIYDRVGVSLALTGKLEGNSLTLHETGIDGNTVSDFNLTVSGATLTGTFKNYKNQKILNVNLKGK